jgi:hypothetical protein
MQRAAAVRSKARAAPTAVSSTTAAPIVGAGQRARRQSESVAVQLVLMQTLRTDGDRANRSQEQVWIERRFDERAREPETHDARRSGCSGQVSQLGHSQVKRDALEHG